MEMHDLVKSLEELHRKLLDLQVWLHLSEKEEEIKKLQIESSTADFWKDQENASRQSRRLGNLQAEITHWEQLKQAVTDLLEMARLDEADQGVNLREEIEQHYQGLIKEINGLEFQTLLGGRYDSRNAVISIHAGSGGTEAQDWAEMLMRMIFRYCESKKWRVTVLDESRGQEAGLKSICFRVAGDFAYGHLKSEHGTHRLVRISPFDAEKMRHTSFALVEVIPELEESEDVKIDDKDIRIDTFMAGGNGGQSVNTTYSAVRLVHIPTGITVTCQNEKSQQQNRKLAMKVLLSRLQKVQEEKDEEERLKLRGEYKSPEWGSQIRSYVLHPYHMVKDLRTRYETTDDEGVLNGELDPFVEAYLRFLKN